MQTPRPQGPLRINRNHPLGRFVQSAWVPGQYIGTTGRPAFAGSPITGPFGGIGAKFNGTSDSVALGSGALIHTSSTSRFALVRTGGVSGNRCVTGGGASSIGLRTAGTTLEIVQVGVTALCSATSAVSSNEYCSLAMSYTGDSGGAIELYKNGIRLATAAQGGARTNNGTDFIGQNGSSSQYWDGEIYLHLSFSRMLTAGEQLQLHADPWQIFEPLRIPVRKAAASGGGFVSLPWTRQPPGFTRLDTNHPLSKGIVSGIDARGWSLVGKATSRAGTINSTGPRPGGVALIGNNAGLISEQFPSGTPIDYPFTVVAYMSRITRTANNNFAAGLGNNGGNQVAVFQLSTSGGASNRFLYRNVNGGASPATNYNANASTSTDVPVVLSATIKGVTNADIDLYWNGVNDTGTGLNSPTSGTPAFDRFAIGGCDRGTDGFADTGNDVLFAFVTSKGWSAADHLAFAKNPWQIFEPIRVPVKAGSASSGAHTTTGAVTGAGATVAGSAAHYTKHTTTGAVTGAGATVTGSATHKTLHTTTGAVQGAGAAVAGAATHPHTTTGAVQGGGASVAGAAEVFTGATHTTTGDVTGGGATVAGTATHKTLHATTGAVQGAGATVAGAATHLTLHTTSGAVQGGGAIVAGAAELISLNGGKSSYLRQWLMAYYEAEWAQKDAVIAQAPLPAVAPKPVVQVARALAKKTVHAAVAATPKAPHRAPQAADPRAAVNEFIQRQTAAVAKRARAAAQSDTQSLAALASRQQQRAAEAEEAEDEEILLLAAVL